MVAALATGTPVAAAPPRMSWTGYRPARTNSPMPAAASCALKSGLLAELNSVPVQSTAQLLDFARRHHCANRTAIDCSKSAAAFTLDTNPAPMVAAASNSSAAGAACWNA